MMGAVGGGVLVGAAGWSNHPQRVWPVTSILASAER